jgi:hypothetical protein
MINGANIMKVYVVRGENVGEPESYVFGVYQTLKEAKARVKFIEENEDYWFGYVWYDSVKLGSDVFLANR